MRFVNPQGFGSGEEFFTYLKDSFDFLYAEGEQTPKMMSVGLHCRLVGRPGRAAALARFLDYIAGRDRVWIATRLDIARHWHREHRALAANAPQSILADKRRDHRLSRQPERRRQGHVRRRTGRYLRARAVGRRGGRRSAAVRDARRLARRDDRGGARGAARAAAHVHQGTPRTCRQGSARRRDDRRLGRRAGERRARSPVGAGIRRIPPAQRQLQGQVRHSVHRLRAAAHQGLRSCGTSRSGLPTTRRPKRRRRWTKFSASRRCVSTSASRPPTGSRCTAGSRRMCSTPATASRRAA